MTRYTIICFIAAIILLPIHHAFAQIIVGTGDTLAISAVGAADCEADWAEVSLSLEGHDKTAQEALLNWQDACERVTTALAKQGMNKENVRCGLPAIAGGNFGPVVMPPPPPGQREAPAQQVSVSSTLTIRISKVNPMTIYAEVCRVVDAAMAAKGVSLTRSNAMRYYGDVNDIVTFGVNDTKPLRDRALANALDNANELANIAAAETGRKLGAIVGLSVQSGINQRNTGLMQTAGAPPKPARATYQTLASVSFRLN